MRSARHLPYLAVLLLAIGLAAPAAAQPEAMSADLTNLLSRLQSMSHGYHPAAEWIGVREEIQAIIARAEREGNVEKVIDATLIEAQVYSDMLGLHHRAFRLLEQLKNRFYGRAEVAGVPKIYMRLAEVQARLGDDNAVDALIREFRDSPHYNPDPIATAGGEQPGVPVVIPRPHARGDASVSVTAMRRQVRKARLAEGRVFPDLVLTDRQGRRVDLASLRGTVVLVDFWLPAWTAWRRELPYLAELHRYFRPMGFEVIGLCLDPAPDDLDGFLARNRMTWPQMTDGLSVAEDLGLAGSAASFLLDRDGVVVGRNLTGGDLSQAIRRALGAPRAAGP